MATEAARHEDKELTGRKKKNRLDAHRPSHGRPGREGHRLRRTSFNHTCVRHRAGSACPRDCTVCGQQCVSPPFIHCKSRMRKRARTDLRGGRSAMVVPTATVMAEVALGPGKRGNRKSPNCVKPS